MRQVIALVVAGGLVAVAALLPAPVVDGVDDVVVRDFPGTATGVGFCPSWTADGEVESDLVIATVDPIEVTMSWQADDEVVAFRAGRDRPGTITGQSGLSQGYVPVLVERISGGAVMAGVVTSGDSVLAASGCARWTATRWVLGVGGTLEGEVTTLVLHNPSAQATIVAVETYSEQGFEVAPALASIAVPPASRVEVDVTGDLRLRERIVFVVDDPIGAVIPALEHRTVDGDRGVTTGVPEAAGWYFPQAHPDIESELVIVNPASFEVAVEVDWYGVDGPELSAKVELVAPRSIWSVTVPVDTAVHVRADNAIGAAMRSEAPGGLALSMGLEAEAQVWMLPGAGLTGAVSTMYLLNTSTETVTVTYRVLGPGGASAGRELDIPSLSMVSWDLDVLAAAGVSVESGAPITAAWVARAPNGALAVETGVPGG